MNMLSTGYARWFASRIRHEHIMTAICDTRATNLYISLACVVDDIVRQECLDAAWHISPHLVERRVLDDGRWFLGRLALVLGGLLFSIVTTYGFGRAAFGSGWLAVGFLVLMDGVMVASSQPSLGWLATGLLIAIEAVTTGCTVARGRMATLARHAKPDRSYRAMKVTPIATSKSNLALKAVA